MMKHKVFVSFCLVMLVAAIYLFATAPVPLESREQDRGAVIPIARMFDTLDAINAKARQTYTKEIVGGGKKIGLAFSEEWTEEEVKAGPLPALFLRAAAAELERSPAALGLFLGSDFPINPSNLFSAEQDALFQEIKLDHEPRFGVVAGDNTSFGMYPDLASAQPCVSCHNEHKDTPKTDWKLGDVMGATTWTYPRSTVSLEEYVAVVDAFYTAVSEAYASYIEEAQGFDPKPEIGDKWPRDGFYLPSVEAFMATVREATSPMALQAIAKDAEAAKTSAQPTPDTTDNRKG